MGQTLKRKLSSTGRSISPPATRRTIAIPRSSENALANTPIETPSHFRIYSWNVNGVGPLVQKQIAFSKSSQEYPLRTFLKRHRFPQILCLQEVKINAQDTATQRRLEQAANAGCEVGECTYTAHFSLPRDKYNATGFGGRVHGVATFIRDDVGQMITTTRRPDWDLEGRVLITETTKGVAVINGYWLNGTSNPYRDPSTGAISGTRHEHKLRFHGHMLNESLALEQAGFYIIHIGDMNIARSRIDGHPQLRTSPMQHVRNRADFNEKFFMGDEGLRAVDVFRHFHGDTRKYTYYPRGRAWGESCDRVDMVIASRALLDITGALTASDICDNPEDRGHSDHVPLWVSVDMNKLGTNLDSDTKSSAKNTKDG